MTRPRTLRSHGTAFLLVAALLISATPAAAGDPPAATGPDLGHHFRAERAEGCFLLADAGGRTVASVNPERAGRRDLPASTFKILNSLIALETGAVKDEHEVIPWDGKKRWLDKWNQDLDMASAFALSAVWFYQEVARRVGLEEMARRVAAAGYGNAEIGDSVDTFWLEGPLRISPEEQIAFLRRLHDGDLPFSERSMEIVKRIMLFERGDGYTVRAKTGWAIRGGENTGWYVGWVEREGGPFYFALNITSEDKQFPMFEARRRILRGILSDLELIPAERPRGSRL